MELFDVLCRVLQLGISISNTLFPTDKPPVPLILYYKLTANAILTPASCTLPLSQGPDLIKNPATREVCVDKG